MNHHKRERLERAGWKVGSAEDFLNEGQPLDRIGQRIEAGSFIAYSTQVCNSAILRVARVISVRTNSAPGQTGEKWRILVQPISSWGEPSLSNKTTLGDPSKIVVLPQDQVSEKIRQVLSPAQPGI